ncbi:MAG: MFS transporter [Alphaproteobacteria bacterium]|nr:MFS transporter [Alphaproteobacteria bacterium]
MSVAVDSTPAGWRVVLACFLSAVFAWGFGFYAHGIYLVELQKAHGWSTGLISSIVTGHYALGALLLPRIAEAIARFGPRAVFLGGLGLTGGPLLLMPSVEAPWQLALLYAVMAPGWNATSVAPIAATIGQWFDKKRGLAINLSLSGATVAGLVVAPALLAAIPRLGFADAERLLVAIGLIVTGLTATLFIRRGPLSPTAAPPRHSRWAPVKRWHFWSIAAPFACVLVAQVGFLTHMVPLVAERGGSIQDWRSPSTRRWRWSAASGWASWSIASTHATPRACPSWCRSPPSSCWLAPSSRPRFTPPAPSTASRSATTSRWRR